MVIEVVTLSCSGDCKQLLAVARGGNGPYAFAWSDGVQGDARQVCSGATSLAVTVTDTAVLDGEFPYAGQTVTADLSVVTQACSDASVGDASVSDAGVLDASTADANVPGGACGSVIGTWEIGSLNCPLRTSHVCPGSAMVAIDLVRPIDPGDTRCFEIHGGASVFGQVNAYISLARDCVPLEGQGTFGQGVPGGGVFRVCFSAMTEHITQIGISPGLGYYEDAYQIAECDTCPTSE